MSELFSLCTA